MGVRRILLSAVLWIGMVACDGTKGSIAPEVRSVATVYSGGKIYTGVSENPTVDKVYVNAHGKIIHVQSGDNDDFLDAYDVTDVDLDGAVMFPGFVDAHAHLRGIGQRELTLNLEGISSVAALVARIGDEVDGLPKGQLIYGRGWIETEWPEGRMPLASDLDAVSPDNPVVLGRADGHALVANSAALIATGITSDTPVPDGGDIHYTKDGKPTGLLIDNAMGLVSSLQAVPSDEEIALTLNVGAETYVARGWTGVHNMSVQPKEATILQALDNDGKMPLRLHNAYNLEGIEIAIDRKYETDTITNRAVKVYMDGALGSRGVQLIQPYADHPESFGLSLMESEALANLMTRAEATGVQLAMHAIGDLANRRILETFESIERQNDLRWRIEHTQVLHPSDISRVGELGLIASMQPSHAIGDLKFAPSRLGMARLRGAYAWRSLIESSALITGGSDAPVEVGSPMIEFYAAVARKDLEGWSGDGWHPEEALSREQALALFTSAPAFAAFMEDELGTIEVGKIADFTVFDRDLMTVPEAEILKANPVMTVVAGEVVWRAEE